jgi:tripeptidyl-peptidase-1
MAPKPVSVTAVKQWLAAHNLTALPLGYGDWFGVETTVAKASALFAANFSVFEHTGTGAKQVRTLEYSIPASLRGHLEVVHPLTRLLSPVFFKQRLSMLIQISASLMRARSGQRSMRLESKP